MVLIFNVESEQFYKNKKLVSYQLLTNLSNKSSLNTSFIKFLFLK